MKRKLSVFLAIMMLVTMLMPFTAMAAENESTGGIPENAEVHVIEVEIPPVEEDSNEDSVSPRLWDQETPTLVNGQSTCVACFSTTCSYAAFETKGVVVSGTYTGTFATNFCDDGACIRGANIEPNGVTAKCDYIPLNSNSTYTINVYNYTGATIYVTVTYYTWN